MTPNRSFIRKSDGGAVECYGEWKDDSNALIIGTDEDGDAFEEVWAEGAETWDEAWYILEPWSERQRITIEELVAC